MPWGKQPTTGNPALPLLVCRTSNAPLSLQASHVCSSGVRRRVWSPVCGVAGPNNSRPGPCNGQAALGDIVGAPSERCPLIESATPRASGTTPPHRAGRPPLDQALPLLPRRPALGGRDGDDDILPRELLLDLRRPISAGGVLLGHEYARAVSPWRARSLDGRHRLDARARRVYYYWNAVAVHR